MGVTSHNLAKPLVTENSTSDPLVLFAETRRTAALIAVIVRNALEHSRMPLTVARGVEWDSLLCDAITTALRR